jgi:hypothetical protein
VYVKFIKNVTEANTHGTESKKARLDRSEAWLN